MTTAEVPVVAPASPLVLLAAGAASAGLLLASVQTAWPALPRPSPLEALAVVSYAWSAWLLARNAPLGWWVGLVGCAAYAQVFLDAGLRAEVGLQAFYGVTSLQAIWLWLRGGPRRTERPISRLPRAWRLPALAAIAAGTGATLWLVTRFRDSAAPLCDALVTVLSVAAHLLLMGRYVESWLLWLAVDTIGVPLYASQGLHLTSALYAVLWVVAARGLLTFSRAVAPREPAP